MPEGMRSISINSALQQQVKGIPHMVNIPKPSLSGRKSGIFSLKVIKVNMEDKLYCHSVLNSVSRKRDRSGERKAPSIPDYYLSIENHSSTRLSLDGWLLYVASAPPYSIPFPSHAAIDGHGELVLVSSLQLWECLKSSVTPHGGTSQSRNIVNHNCIELPILEDVMLDNPPPRSIHILDNTRNHVTEAIEAAAFQGVFPKENSGLSSFMVDPDKRSESSSGCIIQ